MEFVKIEGHEKYLINRKGIVWSTKTNKVLKQKITHDGYATVSLDGKHKKISRLVALAFIPNPKNKAEVDHIDNNKLNNNIENLQWLTREENSKKRSEQLVNFKKKNAYHKDKGIFFVDNRWRVMVGRKYIGMFKTKEEALKIRDEKVKELGRYV